MKKTLWLFIIITVFFATAEPVQAFDPGGWLTQGILAVDKKAAEDMARRGNERKGFSSARNHKDTMSRIKKCLKAETGKRSRR